MEGGLLSLKWNNHRSSFIHVLSSLRKKDSFCDVTIACEGKFYPSHKLVLSTCSEYFQDMFQHTQCKHPVIVLKDIHCEDLEALLNYMYLGEVNVLQEKLSTLIKAAECLKIKGLAVPDDPPKDVGGEKRSSGHDLTPESKRRRTESSKSFSKHFNKSSDSSFRHSGISHESSFPLSSKPSNNEISSPSYNFDNDNSSTALKGKGRDSNFIKQEPPDTFPEVEDSKEGILQTVHADFLRPLPQEDSSNVDVQDETSNIDIMGTDSQEIWGSESRSGDNYPLDGADGGEPGNEDGQPNETVWEEKWPMDNQVVDSKDPLNMNVPWTYDLSSSTSSTTPILGDPSNQNITRYKCPICVKIFPHRGNYKKHLQTHTGEKPFACRFCNYRATQKIHVSVHTKRVHHRL